MAAIACGMIGLPLAAAADEIYIPPTNPTVPAGGAMVTGEVTAINATAIRLALRDGQSIAVDLSAAQQKHLVGVVFVGEFLTIQGSLSGGQMTAVSAYRAKSNPDAWMPDIP
jgi:hypothetical protein